MRRPGHVPGLFVECDAQLRRSCQWRFRFRARRMCIRHTWLLVRRRRSCITLAFDKPWKNPWCDFASLYWSYAQETPFVAQMVAAMSGVERPVPPEHHERAIAEDSPIRKYVDVLAPTGSKQRELMKVSGAQGAGQAVMLLLVFVQNIPIWANTNKISC